MSKLIYSVLKCTISQDSIRESPLEASTQAHTRQPHQEATDSDLSAKTEASKVMSRLKAKIEFGRVGFDS